MQASELKVERWTLPRFSMLNAIIVAAGSSTITDEVSAVERAGGTLQQRESRQLVILSEKPVRSKTRRAELGPRDPL
jgi:hypothetical protein